jgi:hypothetical protein
MDPKKLCHEISDAFAKVEALSLRVQHLLLDSEMYEVLKTCHDVFHQDTRREVIDHLSGALGEYKGTAWGAYVFVNDGVGIRNIVCLPDVEFLATPLDRKDELSEYQRKTVAWAGAHADLQ